MNILKNNSLRFSKVLIIAMILGSFNTLRAEDLRKIIDLSGLWRFSIGDDNGWADPKLDDSKWDKISVPSRWEDQGYNDYNGYAWYRKQFTVSDFPNNGPVYLILGNIDDVDEVYLNGKLIGHMGIFPPSFATAYSLRRKYLITADQVRLNEINTIAIKIYDSFMDGGIINGPIGLFTDEDNIFLDFSLAGVWKFQCGDNKEWASANFTDDGWKQIHVPDAWENQGYSEYDGYAWYRNEFQLPANLKDQKLFLSMGKIDDIDYVYLNGILIGTVYELKKDGDYKRKGFEYNARRLYEIPENVLKTSGKNIIAVRVYDQGLIGGIYEGPVGIMTESNYKRYRNKHYQKQSFIDFMLEGLYD